MLPLKPVEKFKVSFKMMISYNTACSGSWYSLHMDLLSDIEVVFIRS